MCVCTPFFFPLSRMVAYDSKPYLISYRRSWRPTMPPISQFGVVDSIDLSQVRIVVCERMGRVEVGILGEHLGSARLCQT